MERRYYVIDAFANERFTGNPAAVVLDADGLGDHEMQSIAAEFNQSETTFVLPPHAPAASVRFRWFTPTTEVSMCGHATIAGVHAMVQTGLLRCEGVDSTTVRIDTLSGTLTAFVEAAAGRQSGKMIWLDMPRPRLADHPIDVGELSSVLNLPVDVFEGSLPIVETQDSDLLVFVKDFLTVNEARPDYTRLKAVQVREKLRGLCLATTRTLTQSIHVQSRFFAPAAGVDEDPVTGSVHGPLVAYVVAHGLVPMENGLAALQCVQAKAGGRAGVVYALAQQQDEGCEVRIGGQAVTIMRGTLAP